MTDILKELQSILEQRKGSNAEDSYVASLYQKGLDKILEKVGEEAIEVILAAKNAEQSGKSEDLLGEVADLWFHSMVMLSHLEIDHAEVLKILEKRFGISGHEEKASRN